jgi:hypothetical protein
VGLSKSSLFDDETPAALRDALKIAGAFQGADGREV